MSSKVSHITLQVEVDENNIPEKLAWTAPDGGIQNEATKALFLAVWDHKHLESLRVDLWTKDMPVDQMKEFFHQTLVSMANTYERATNDHLLAETMRDFCAYFGEKIKGEE